MTIKEVESLTGITKQNIRFYEKKNLLSPQRNQDNSYREYANEDVDRLLQIKILRKLDVSIENIRLILDGEDPAAIIQNHLDDLLEKKSSLDAAIHVCRYMLRTDDKPWDAHAVLSKMDEMEQKGGHFMAIINDYKKISHAGSKMTFKFMPDTLVHTPEDFTKVLCKYGMERNLNLVVTEEGMYPKFEIDGLEYQATRHTGRYGHVVYCQVTNPDLLQQEYSEIESGRRRILSKLYSGIKILTVPVFLLIMIFGASPALAVMAFFVFLLMEATYFFLVRKG